MMNQLYLVGRIVNAPEITETESGKKVTTLTLAVPRNYKNEKGEYESDFIRCNLWGGVAENTVEYCQKGDLVGIRGRLQSNSYEDKEGNKKFSLDVTADKVSFLASKQHNEPESER